MHYDRLLFPGALAVLNAPGAAAALIVLATVPAVTSAHQPIFSDGTNVDSDTALAIEDIDLSQVVYGQLSPTGPQLWLTFNGQEGRQLYVQLGLPQIDRLADFRPSLAVIGPGLPPATLPFETPAGSGAEVIQTQDIVNPEAFYEPFTGTDSWILTERTLTLPASGQYYIVAYSPSGQLDKLWVAVGKREEFTAADFARFGQITTQVREFHEAPAGTSPPCFLFPAAAGLIGWGFLRLTRARRRSR